MSGTLYIVATPIGNLEDITLRALRILKEADLIVAEDTRVTKKLLDKYDIKKDILSYHQQSSLSKKFDILSELVKGKNLALVTDAGTPGISDPGNELLNFLYEKEPKISVVPIPGASSVTTALSVAGMNTNRFVFVGFLPKKGLNKFLDRFFSLALPLVYFDSPHRVVKNLEKVKEIFGPYLQVFIARELTKMHESLYRGTISEVLGQFSKEKVKGEIVVILKQDVV